MQTDSVSSELAHHAVKEHTRSVAHYPHVCHFQQDPIFAKEREIHAGSRTNSTTSLPVSSTGRCAGSLDRRRRRFRSRVDRDQRAMSHSDLICHERDRPQHYCSLQQFHCGSNMCINNYHSKTEVYCIKELLIKLPIVWYHEFFPNPFISIIKYLRYILYFKIAKFFIKILIVLSICFSGTIEKVGK